MFLYKIMQWCQIIVQHQATNLRSQNHDLMMITKKLCYLNTFIAHI